MPNAWERDEWAQAPFDSATTDRLRSLITALDVGQRLWLSGFLAGSTAPVGANPPASQPATAQRSVATILYGSQSGNSERVARLLHDKLKERQIESTLLDMMDCKKSHLQSAQELIVIVSTHGDAELKAAGLDPKNAIDATRIRERLDALLPAAIAPVAASPATTNGPAVAPVA